MERNDKIAIVTATIISASAIIFAIQAKKFRTKWEDATARIDAVVKSTETIN